MVHDDLLDEFTILNFCIVAISNLKAVTVIKLASSYMVVGSGS